MARGGKTHLLSVDLPLHLDRVRSVRHSPARPDRRIFQGGIEKFGLDGLDMERPFVHLGDHPVMYKPGLEISNG